MGWKSLRVKSHYVSVTSKLRKMDLKREGSRKDGVWKDGQTLVSQVSARKQTLRVERTLFIARFGIRVNVS